MGAKEERISKKDRIVVGVIVDGLGGVISTIVQNNVTKREKQEKSLKTGMSSSLDSLFIIEFVGFGAYIITFVWIISRIEE